MSVKITVIFFSLHFFCFPIIIFSQSNPIFIKSKKIKYQDINSDSGLVAYYPFTGNANDESGNRNDAIVSGATLTEDRTENPESAYNFDGIDDAIAIPFSADFDFSGAREMSFGLWFRLNSLKSCSLLKKDSG